MPCPSWWIKPTNFGIIRKWYWYTYEMTSLLWKWHWITYQVNDVFLHLYFNSILACQQKCRIMCQPTIGKLRCCPWCNTKNTHFYCQALDSMVYMKAHINHLYDFFSTIQKIPLQHHPLPQIFRVASFMRLIVK